VSDAKDPIPRVNSPSPDSPGRPSESPSSEPDATLDSSGPSSSAELRATVEFKSIGPYRLIKKLGEGGMGLVWLAEQTAPVHRHVALKLIRAGLYDDSILQRFRAEQQSLAVMNHPAIAKVFDAGSTSEGQPYFVMEYVDGPSITRYCDAKKLSIRERLELFIKVCEGVQHAHQKAIIHRDLKPSNVLVTELDGKPVPRIIDFGIAKAVSSQTSPDQTMFTQAGVLVGTPGFMSPEQADPNIIDVDTRTDVYSLGVILYAVLTGMLPFDTEQWKKKPFDEVLRQLREVDPPSPSMRLRTEKETATAAAEHRGTEPRHLVNLLHGDLDWITLKAIEKDRTRRYGTPSELAADLQRYLNNEPVLARPASAGYRLQKYARRHRLGVSVAAAAVVLLVAFAITQAIQLRRITRERDRANRITDFMTSMFKVSDPSESRGNTITAREVLDKASTGINQGLRNDSELQATMMSVMGAVYMNLGLYPTAQSLLERASTTRQQVLGPRNPDTLTVNDQLAWVYFYEGRYPDAEKLDRQTFDLRRAILGPENPQTLVSMNHLAAVLSVEAKFSEAEKTGRDLLAIRRRVSGSAAPETADALATLAATFERQGHYKDAEPLDREALDIRTRALGREHPDTVFAITDLSWVLSREGKLAEAEKLQREALEIRNHLLGPEHPLTVDVMARLSVILEQEARYPEAEALQRKVLAARRRTLGTDHPETALSIDNLATTLMYEDKLTEAEALLRGAIDIDKRIIGPNHPDTLSTMSNLAGVLGAEDKFSDAEKLMRQVLAAQERQLGPKHPATINTTYNLGLCLARLNQHDQAISLFTQVLQNESNTRYAQLMVHNEFLNSLKRDKRYAALIAHAQQLAAPAQQPAN
jgi:eukaryotic-like serine/threonine-protein kinase